MNDRRRPGSAAPRAATPAVVVVVTLIAAILGFLILKQFRQDGTSATKSTSAEGASPGTTGPVSGAADPAGNTLAPAVATPTNPPAAPVAIPRTGYNVLVANASKVKGTAKSLTEQMQKDSFQTNPPTNAVISDVLPAMPIPVTRVMYSPDFATAAADVANYLGLTATEVMPAAGPPIEAGAGVANVIVLLGTDLAGNVPPGANGGAATTAPVAVATTPPTSAV